MLEQEGLSFSVSQADANARTAIWDGLVKYNLDHVGEYASGAIDIYVRNSTRTVVAGLISDYFMRWCSVHAIWVDDCYRNAGIGTRLMDMLESHAFTAGCLSICLETFSFQARGFYEKRGYHVVSELADFPPGHSRYTLVKSTGYLDREDFDSTQRAKL
jgi:ribosomal protein S18 acetylase RimI-like enzyme